MNFFEDHSENLLKANYKQKNKRGTKDEKRYCKKCGRFRRRGGADLRGSVELWRIDSESRRVSGGF
jgi:hypothetical protein